MTINELVDLAKKMGFEVIDNRYSNIALKYYGSKFGEILIRDEHSFKIHSHHWKKQDQLIDEVELSKFKEALNAYIMKIKKSKLEKKLKDIEQDF